MPPRLVSDAVFDPKNKYEFPSTLIIRTPSEVGTLLGASTLATPSTPGGPLDAAPPANGATGEGPSPLL